MDFLAPEIVRYLISVQIAPGALRPAQIGGAPFDGMALVSSGGIGVWSGDTFPTWPQLNYLLAEKSDEGHNHDNRYWPLSTDLATQAELDAHINDTSDAHDASAISYAGGPGMSATDVEAAVDELATEKANTADAVMDGDAAGGVLSGTYPNPGFAVDMATQAELDAHTGDTSDAHDASAISVLDSDDYYDSTDVEAALAELGSNGVFSLLSNIGYILAEKSDEGHNHKGYHLFGLNVSSTSTVTTTGNLSFTGLRFKPKMVVFFGSLTGETTNPAMGVGYMDQDGNQGATYISVAGAAQRGTNSTSVCWQLANTAGTLLKSFTFVSMDDDGFTINRATNDGTAFRMFALAIG